MGLDEQSVQYGEWQIHILVQRVCADCLIREGESFNDGPQVAQEAKTVNVWNIELVASRACESHPETIEGSATDSPKAIEA